MGNENSKSKQSKQSKESKESKQGSGRPTSTYSRYTGGAGLGSYTHNSQAGNRAHDRSIYIGRVRLAEVKGI